MLKANGSRTLARASAVAEASSPMYAAAAKLLAREAAPLTVTALAVACALPCRPAMAYTSEAPTPLLLTTEEASAPATPPAVEASETAIDPTAAPELQCTK